METPARRRLEEKGIVGTEVSLPDHPSGRATAVGSQEIVVRGCPGQDGLAITGTVLDGRPAAQGVDLIFRNSRNRNAMTE
jgi:hypothetical protein